MQNKQLIRIHITQLQSFTEHVRTPQTGSRTYAELNVRQLKTKLQKMTLF